MMLGERGIEAKVVSSARYGEKKCRKAQRRSGILCLARRNGLATGAIETTSGRSRRFVARSYSTVIR